MRHHFQIPIIAPTEIIPRLGKPELHWKEGYSAYELATAWMETDGIPQIVREVIEQAGEWRGCTLLEAFFERETDLPAAGRPSQTDLLAILRTGDGNVILGVEGKVRETFGPIISDWLGDGENPNKAGRLAGLCSTLAVQVALTGPLYYQLFHRTCAAIYEAKRFGYGRAMMLVHSFDCTDPKQPAGFAQFQRFAKFVGMPVDGPNLVSSIRICDGVEVRLAWVSDRPKATRLAG
jgi:hypothetical protein